MEVEEKSGHGEGDGAGKASDPDRGGAFFFTHQILMPQLGSWSSASRGARTPATSPMLAAGRIGPVVLWASRTGQSSGQSYTLCRTGSVPWHGKAGGGGGGSRRQRMTKRGYRTYYEANGQAAIQQQIND